jgi:HD-like signal output (HDOD) protein
VRDVVTLLASDQALVSELLRRVNSAYYGLSRRIPTVQQAVTVLGMNALHHLVISVGVTHVFLSGGDSHRRTLEALWSHSLRCAVTARYLGQRSRTLRADECFTAGILHDVGRLAMIHGLGGAWSSFVATSREKVPSIAAERAAFGFDHAQTGVWLAARWKLPAPLVQSIGRHHDPPVAEKDEAPGAEMARLIAVADWLAWESVRRESPGGEVRTLPPALTRFAGDFSLTDESLDAVLAALTREVQEADRVMGAAVAGAGPAATPTTGPARRR